MNSHNLRLRYVSLLTTSYVLLANTGCMEKRSRQLDLQCALQEAAVAMGAHAKSYGKLPETLEPINGIHFVSVRPTAESGGNRPLDAFFLGGEAIENVDSRVILASTGPPQDGFAFLANGRGDVFQYEMRGVDVVTLLGSWITPDQIVAANKTAFDELSESRLGGDCVAGKLSRDPQYGTMNREFEFERWKTWHKFQNGVIQFAIVENATGRFIERYTCDAAGRVTDVHRSDDSGGPLPPVHEKDDTKSRGVINSIRTE